MGNTKATGVAYDDPDFGGTVTCAGSLYVAGSAITGSDVSVLAGVTPGTAAASKAVVLNSSKGIATITSATITTLTSTTANISGVATAATFTNSTATGQVIANASAGLYILSTAITANSTTTAAPAGSLGITTNATGLGKLFYADGTKWQFMAIS